jgi:hypothetical protein
MRTTPLIGRKAWFGPRRYGWGLSPVSSAGWAVTGIAIAAVVATVALGRSHAWIVLLIVAVLLLVSFLKGTSPGGPAQWDEYKNQRGGGN